MKHDKTTIIGVAICVLLLFGWSHVLRWMGYDTRPRPAAAEQKAAPGTSEAANETANETVGSPSQPVQPVPNPVAPVAPVPVSEDLTTKAQKPWVASGDAPVALDAPDGTFQLRVDPLGGGVIGVVLNEYFQDSKAGGSSDQPELLGRPELPLCALNLAQGGWTGSPGEVLAQDATRLSIQRAITGPGGQTARLVEEWTIVGPESPYQFDYTVRLEGTGVGMASLTGVSLEAGGLPPTTSAERARFRASATTGVMVATVGAKRPLGLDQKKISKLDPEELAELEKAPTEWLGVHSQYFLFEVAAPNGMAFAGALPTVETFDSDAVIRVGKKLEKMPWYRGRLFLPSLSAAQGTTSELTFRCYAGPKKLQILSQLPGRVDKVMGIDTFMGMTAAWMGWLTKLLLGCLVGLKAVFSGPWGYGWAIIIITVAVKVLFFPLSHKSTQSMRKMQALQPQLKELRERYKDDPQKMYRKQQELFKENNVSQLGGCLPMLVQIPVFFGLYNTFRCAIELRQASFLWVADLSLPDTLSFSPDGIPIRPLALIMSGSMLLQQKMTPSADPSQQRMMMFMSLFFLWIFYGMPSGLTLYWTVNQILTIAQTLITHRLEARQKAAEGSAGGPSAGRA